MAYPVARYVIASSHIVLAIVLGFVGSAVPEDFEGMGAKLRHQP